MKSMIALITLVMLAMSCSGITDGRGEKIPASIRLIYESGQEFTLGEDIEVILQNESGYCLRFPADFGMRIFVNEELPQKELRNRIIYHNLEFVDLKPKGEVFSARSILIRPDFGGLSINKPTFFYATISGYLCDDSSTEFNKNIPFTVVP